MSLSAAAQLCHLTQGFPAADVPALLVLICYLICVFLKDNLDFFQTIICAVFGRMLTDVVCAKKCLLHMPNSGFHFIKCTTFYGVSNVQYLSNGLQKVAVFNIQSP